MIESVQPPCINDVMLPSGGQTEHYNNSYSLFLEITSILLAFKVHYLTLTDTFSKITCLSVSAHR